MKKINTLHFFTKITCNSNREGQLLVDQLLDYLNITPKQKQTALRCLISDLNTQAVKKSTGVYAC